jgi:hypothetical protein
MKTAILASLSVAAVAAVSPATHAAPLLVDFGDSTGYVGSNTPANADGFVTGDQTFVGMGPGDRVAVSDVFGTTVTVDQGRNGGSSGDTVNTPSNRTPTAVGDTAGPGIFGTELTEDSLQSFVDSDVPADTFRAPVGAQIEGLPAGQYVAYIVAHYGGNLDQTMRVFAGVLDDQEDFSAGDLTFLDALTATNTATWQDGNNYSRINFTLADGEEFPLLVDDPTVGSPSDNTTMTSLQIYQIPEPASLALLGLGGLTMLAGRNRRRA